jgi:TIR domain/Pentapeptide repeats (8 copies)
VPDLRAADLANADLRRANLQGADLTGANLRGADLREALVFGACLTGCELAGSQFELPTEFVQFLRDRTNFRTSTIESICKDDIQPYVVFTSNANVIKDAVSDGITQNRAMKRKRNRQVASAKSSTKHFAKSALPSSEQVEAFPPKRILFSLVKPFCNELWQEYQLSNRFSSCFISYAHSDKEFAARLHNALEAHGVQSWLDEKQILPGRDIYAEIDGAIRQCDKILLCCSEASLNSWWG